MLRGEVWWIDFNPSVGGEIQKVRPAIIISNDSSNKIEVCQNLIFFINECNYYKENNFCYKCDFLNHSVKDCKFSFNFNQIFVKNNKIKSQFYKI